VADFSFWMVVVVTGLVGVAVLIWLVSLFSRGKTNRTKESDGV